MKQRAVVTGGHGFIGGYVVNELLARGYDVVVIDTLSANRKNDFPLSVQHHVVDICDTDALKLILQEDDIVFHLAALTSVPGSFEHTALYRKTNVDGTKSLLDAAITRGASGVIFSSSAAVYGNQEGVMSEELTPLPTSPYGEQKYQGELLCQEYTKQYGLPTVVLRYFNVYGEGNNETGAYAPVTARFLKAKREGRPLEITGDGSQTRDFVYVKDVATVNAEAISLLNKNAHICINVATGTPISINDIATLIGGEKLFLPARNEIQHSVADIAILHQLFPEVIVTSIKDWLKRCKS